MDKNKEDILALYRRFLANQCSEKEIEQLLTYFGQEAEEDFLLLTREEFLRQATKEEPSTAETMKLIQLQGNINRKIGTQKELTGITKSYFSRVHTLVAAAVLLILISAGNFIWHKSQRRHFNKSAPNNLPKEIAAGHTGAILRLSDGHTIVLDSAINGTLAVQGNVKVIKDKNGIKYTGSNQTVLFNSIETGPGKEYHFILPDGSAVWLNAASSIVYPTCFTGKKRRVKVTGEVYFQVVHNVENPFVVQVGNQLIEDVGTAFNVNAYPDESGIRTTVAEGAARIIIGRQSAILKPGQQAYVNSDLKIIPHADMETVLGWRNGSFQFHNTNLREVMRQIGRWYNVSTEYKGDIVPQLFTGRIPRNMAISKVLIILEELGVKFSIKQVPQNGEKGIITVTR